MDSSLAIIEFIRSAFANVSRGAVSLHEAYVIDYGGSMEERKLAREKDTDSNWQQVPDETLEGFPYALHFVDIQSWRYYIPAFMIWVLKNYRTSQSMTMNTIFSTLDVTGEAEWGLRPRTIERFHSLDRNQSQAVFRFLKFISAESDPEDDMAAQCLEAYWSQFGDQWQF